MGPGIDIRRLFVLHEGPIDLFGSTSGGVIGDRGLLIPWPRGRDQVSDNVRGWGGCGSGSPSAAGNRRSLTGKYNSTMGSQGQHRSSA